MNLRTILMIASCTMLAACGTPPKFQSTQPAASAATGYQMGRALALDETNHMVGHLDADKNIVYSQAQGGGGAAVGILLGPLGVLANVKMIESKTKSDVAVLVNKLNIKPATLFADAARKGGLKIGGAQQAARLSPYVFVSKIGDDRLLVLAALMVEQTAIPEKWTGKYMFQTARAYTLAQLSSLDANGSRELNDALSVGFARLVEHVRDEKPGQAELERKIAYKSRMIFPGADLDLPGSLIADEADLVWLRTFNGVYALRKTDLTYVPAQ